VIDKTHDEPVAIIGMACIFPGASSLKRYWDNIVNGVDAISVVPEHRWSSKFYDPDSQEVDRFYCRRGGFVDEYVDFDPLKYGVMPKAAGSADPDQLLSLRVGVEALADAGYASKEFPREKTGVIIGRGNYLSAGTLRLEQHVRLVQQTIETLQDLLPDITTEQLERVRGQIKSRLDYYGPDVAIGMIPNLVASRLANRLDLQGPAYTVDAACASSLIAIEQACDALRSGQCDLMLTGGLHFTHDLTFWATFCQLGALSRSQVSRPLAANADGILAGEGIGMLVLKRLSDAERDGDRIYAAINGVASASDGRSSSLLAPSVDGQLLALRRAWGQTSLSRDQLGLLEAHGTGTPAGDQAELQTLKKFFGDWSGQGEQPVVGSVKSMIGHTMPAAGVAGVIKAALSIYHGVLPPSLHCEKPHKLLSETRFRVLSEAQPWPASLQRIAGVNAFGFGGINAHVVLSHYPVAAGLAGEKALALPQVVTIVAETQRELLDCLRRRQWNQPGRSGKWRLAIVQPDEKRIELAGRIVEKGKAWHGRNQIYFSQDALISAGGKLAFVFPGVDSSFEPRAEDVAEYFNMPLSEFCFPADPADVLFRVVLGLNKFNHMMFNVMNRLNIKADGMAGHSIGEFSAMSAGGMLSQARVSAVMSVLEQDPESLKVPDVIFLAAACGVETAGEVIRGLPDICVSHDNCPHQVILCGKVEQIDVAAQRLLDRSVLSQKLPFVSGFHSPMFAEHMQQYRDFYAETELFEPNVPVWSATSAEIFPESMQEKKQLALDHLLQPVRFRQLVENMYAAGYRAFIQVGTGSLVGFIDDTLKNKEYLAISANISKRSGMEQLVHLVAALWVEGAETDLTLLGLEEGVSHSPAITSNSIKLRLGVPLVSLAGMPPIVQGLAASQVGEMAGAGTDPMRALFGQTMLSIQQAGQDVLSLWNERQKTRGMAGVVSTPLPAAVQSDELMKPFKKVIRQHLDINSNISYVTDHELYPQREGWPVPADRHPVVPLTMEVMLIREAIEANLPGYAVIRFEEIHAFNWLVVDRPLDVEIRLDLQCYPTIDVAIEGYMKARAVIDTHYPAPPNSRSDGQRSGVFERRRKNRTVQFENQRMAAVDARALYEDRWMFHGPAYQGITQLGPIADNGISGRIKVTHGKGALLDNMGQLAGYWVMEQERDCLAMPISVDRICFFGPEPDVGQEFDCQIWVRHLDGISCVTDQQLLNDHGQVVITMDGWQTRRYQMDRDFFMQTKQIHQKLVCESLDEGVVLFHDRYDTAIVRDYLAKRFLNRPEVVEYEAVSPKRRRQWLNGRVAAKDAVRKYLWTKLGRFDLYPKELRIEKTRLGQPLVAAHLIGHLSEPVQISIAHKDLLAIAMAAEGPVGVDIEKIEHRTREFLDIAMSPDEIELLPEDGFDEWVTRFWVAKEACSKSQGTGLEGNPKHFRIQKVVDQDILVNDRWVTTCRKDDYIVGWTI
jgi:acyl transferase domain-containing protein/phosphopantetheinyl transferase